MRNISLLYQWRSDLMGNSQFICTVILARCKLIIISHDTSTRQQERGHERREKHATNSERYEIYALPVLVRRTSTEYRVLYLSTYTQ